MKKVISYFFIISTLLFILIAMIQPVSADFRSDLDAQLQATAGSGGADFGETRDPRIVFATGIRNGLKFIGTLVLIYLVYGGFLILTSSGEQDKMDKGRKSIQRAIIGLVLILSSYSITLYFTTRFVELKRGNAAPSGVTNEQRNNRNQDFFGN